MTEKHTIVNKNGDHVKDPSWFSWRHKTRDEHETATAVYLVNHGRSARREKAQERARQPHLHSGYCLDSCRITKAGC